MHYSTNIDVQMKCCGLEPGGVELQEAGIGEGGTCGHLGGSRADLTAFYCAATTTVQMDS